VRFLHEQREVAARRPRAYVPWTELWMVETGEVVGRISLRHELNELLFTWGGHIGYSVRPSARCRGHATAALAGMLEVCRERRIDPVLITCDVDNVASRRTIEGAGGVFEDTRDGKLRFWVDLG
jgi:predicted acetyltransferase